MELIEARARAYVYGGDWIADCPRPCGNAEHLFRRTDPGRPDSPRLVPVTEFTCSYCRLTAPVEWPKNMPEIMEVLALRPVPHTRNWYPKDHEGAIRFRVPHGQSVADLKEENAAHGVPAV